MSSPSITVSIWLVPHGYQITAKNEATGETRTSCSDFRDSYEDAEHVKDVTMCHLVNAMRSLEKVIIHDSQ